ncbi:MAG TPA: hypothetical protein VNU97_01085 [Rhizomicrobium sp.]|jgi:hypothetical protein|nr:hypothetical protein [Rhizomicrobium sp.]
MTEVATSELKKAVESQHIGKATVPADESLQGQPVRRGTAHIFGPKDHPTAKQACAWSYARPDGKRRFSAVLHTEPMASPRDALRTVIVAEAKT